MLMLPHDVCGHLGGEDTLLGVGLKENHRNTTTSLGTKTATFGCVPQRLQPFGYVPQLKDNHCNLKNCNHICRAVDALPHGCPSP